MVGSLAIGFAVWREWLGHQAVAEKSGD